MSENEQLSESLLDPDSQERAATRGSQPALIESFGIRGLYGYRTISLASNFAATIVIAKNGTGKTTLIGALDAFLRLQLPRLRNLDFKEIFCRLRDIDEELVLTHEDVNAFLEGPADTNFLSLASRTGMTPESLLSFLLGDYNSALNNYFNDNDSDSPTNRITRVYSHSPKKAKEACSEIIESLFNRYPKVASLRRALQQALQGYEIVYLPTYRRVELALPRGRQRNWP